MLLEAIAAILLDVLEEKLEVKRCIEVRENIDPGMEDKGMRVL